MRHLHTFETFKPRQVQDRMQTDVAKQHLAKLAEERKHFTVVYLCYAENGSDELTPEYAEKDANKFKTKMVKFLDKKGFTYTVEEDNDHNAFGYTFDVIAPFIINNIDDVINIFPEDKFSGAVVIWNDYEEDLN